MRNLTPCFEGFKEFILEAEGTSVVVGRDYVVGEYGLVIFVGEYRKELYADSKVWQASWNNAAKFYNSFR
jgi:hypothetical protein